MRYNRAEDNKDLNTDANHEFHYFEISSCDGVLALTCVV